MHSELQQEINKLRITRRFGGSVQSCRESPEKSMQAPGSQGPKPVGNALGGRPVQFV